jgi:hypothetical protein
MFTQTVKIFCDRYNRVNDSLSTVINTSQQYANFLQCSAYLLGIVSYLAHDSKKTKSPHNPRSFVLTNEQFTNIKQLLIIFCDTHLSLTKIQQAPLLEQPQWLEHRAKFISLIYVTKKLKQLRATVPPAPPRLTTEMIDQIENCYRIGKMTSSLSKLTLLVTANGIATVFDTLGEISKGYANLAARYIDLKEIFPEP